MTKNDTFTIEHTTETAASREAIWALFRDTARWSEWNAGVESIHLEGPFAEGTWFTMKTPEQPEPLRSRLLEVRDNERFVDETRVGDLVVRVAHRLERAGSKTRITYSLAAEGPGASQIGPAIAADFPEVLAALVKRAARA
jgi:uncharacterized protein YndB with AHSA1/START domain